MIARSAIAFMAALAIAMTTTAPLSSAQAKDRSFQNHHAKTSKGYKRHRHASKKRYGKKNHAKKRKYSKNHHHGKRYHHAKKRHYKRHRRYYGKRYYHGQRRYYGKRYYHGHRRYYGRRYYNNDALWWGFFGLATGAIIAGSYSVGKADIEPWSDEWFRYCANKYRSFNAATGTYRGYDGYDHFCVVN